MSRQPTIDDVMHRRTRRARRANNDTYAAMALMAATVIALIWANVGGSYDAVWNMVAGVHIGELKLDLTLAQWVDEGIMTVFFFSVGLDVRREFTLGELQHPGRAALPISAAIGGLVVPATIFLALTRDHEYTLAWGSVISTDTAFALGMLALVGPRNAPRLRVFLLTLAVVDDIGALGVIALFYTERLNPLWLGASALGVAGVWLLQRFGVWRVTPFVIVGILTWLALLHSGVHATLAGVLIALFMPVYPPRTRDLEYASVFFHLFHQAPAPHSARTVRDAVTYTVPVNQRLSAMLPAYINYLVVPLFAVANAGVPISAHTLSQTFESRLTWAVIASLVLGKLLGITAAAALTLRLLPTARLPGLDLPRIAGAAALSGMGFTISLLVVGIALDDTAGQDQARVGVLSASASALLLAWLIFQAAQRFSPLPPPAGLILERGVDLDRDHHRGPDDAAATLVVYAAMNDAYRRHTAVALKEVRQQLGDAVRIIYRHHTTDDADMLAALALEAAGKEDRFWELHDVLVTAPEPLNESNLDELVRRADLDTHQVLQRIQRGKDHARIDDDNLDAQSADLPDIPAVFIQRTRVQVPPNSWQLTRILSDAVQQANQKAGPP